MATAYSLDLRERVLKDCDSGIRSEEVAQNTLSVPLGFMTFSKNVERRAPSPPKQ